jgi:formate hydrogenlyase subunit 3/multisubunit Na+/H+ antiporter MnhD subunit
MIMWRMVTWNLRFMLWTHAKGSGSGCIGGVSLFLAHHCLTHEVLFWCVSYFVSFSSFVAHDDRLDEVNKRALWTICPFMGSSLLLLLILSFFIIESKLWKQSCNVGYVWQVNVVLLQFYFYFAWPLCNDNCRNCIFFCVINKITQEWLVISSRKKIVIYKCAIC